MIITASSPRSTAPCHRYSDTMPGRILTQAHSRRSTSSRPMRSASTTDGWVVYTNTTRSLFMSINALPRLRRFVMPKSRPAHSYKRIAFVASDVAAAQRARRHLVQRYGDARPETADVVVALGGDGLMLATLQRFMNSGKPIYGMHRGTVGFLMNVYSEQDLHKRLAAAHVTVIHPLLMRARDAAGRVHRHRAINEVSLFR